MSFWNKTLAAIALTFTVSAPAFADGTPGQRVNRGPAPVQAHQPVPPEPGCYLIENGQVAFMHADADYRKRLEPARVLAAAGIAGS